MSTSLRPAPRPQIDAAAAGESISSSSSLMSPQRGWSGSWGFGSFGTVRAFAAFATKPRPDCWLEVRSKASTFASKMLRDKSWLMLTARLIASSFSSFFASHALFSDGARSKDVVGGGVAGPSEQLTLRCSASASGAISGLVGPGRAPARWSWWPWSWWCSSSQCTLACKSSRARVRSFSELCSRVRDASMASSSAMSVWISRCRSRWVRSSSSALSFCCRANCRSRCAWICCIFSLIRAATSRISFSSPSVLFRSFVSSRCCSRMASSDGFAGDTCILPPLFSSSFRSGGFSVPSSRHALLKETSSSKSTKAKPLERPLRLSTKRETMVTSQSWWWKKSPISSSSS
mmetsp:Transcript_8201/g.24318  ORF Transcript_8201/g.24318 Transcript_8201/m.24318 type:complete len:347 (+) Transcript_8201:771-1811(+)